MNADDKDLHSKKSNVEFDRIIKIIHQKIIIQ